MKKSEVDPEQKKRILKSFFSQKKTRSGREY